MSTSYFSRSGDWFIPGDAAAGPWAPDMLHGRLLGGLAAREIEKEYGEPGWRAARLTVDMFRPAGFEPTEVSLCLVRRGRRIKVVDALVSVGGHEVVSARAVLLVEGPIPPGTIWQAERWASPHPETLARPEPREGDEVTDEDPVWDFRIHEGGFRTADRTRVWTRESGFLVDDEPVSPLVRAAMSGDMASPLANGGDRGVGYINGDYTLAMARYPQGEWVGLETTNHLAADGIAVGALTLYDLDGPFAISTATALSNPILD
ncbi:MAG: thioesterase family protein [Actinomycetia bacterium]|nr:thioesterase family protein [Actinomycetes bacterium]